MPEITTTPQLTESEVEQISRDFFEDSATASRHIPALIRDLRALRAENGDLRKSVEEWVTHYNEVESWRAQLSVSNAALREQLTQLEGEVTFLNDKYLEREAVCASAAATRMRDKCVEKVKAMRDEWESKRNGLEPLSKLRNRYDAAFCAANEIITTLESLTLDQVEQKQENS